MKKFICLFLVLITISIFYGCNKFKNAEPEVDLNNLVFVGNTALKEQFDNIITVEGALEDSGEIDISMKMGTTAGYGKRTEGSGAEKKTYYYKDSELIYAVYEGDQDKRWDYFTYSKSGAELDIVFWQEGSTKFVKVVAEDYEILYQGGKLQSVKVKDEDEFATYTLSGQNYYISEANHIIATGAMYTYESEIDVDTGKIVNESDELAK